MDEEQTRFVDAMGDTLASWNLPRATGRVYGYLLLRGEPSTSERLRADLALSAGAVSTSTRELVSWGLARTIAQPGSRRLLVEAAGGFEQLLSASHVRARAFIRTLRAAQELTDDDRAARRLRDVTDLFAAYVEAGEQMLRGHTQT
ncbi:transcriptional regulator [Nonomuraea sp. WAC 01424]|uniref:GbsR/MarR family transcriptional regulator n=1 Tax=Nonomuraea sp. WAC 01424 TaxID=2203200 RepID=UPI000F7923CB|nr:transcriptional regulator [Nonomuraea sp. WAC 01424]RSN11544.1 transcriptional regulator [Nonomuraea sp. WAC 01424]